MEIRIGYEISYAYTSFDNATMYPLILLILLLSLAANSLLSHWEKRNREAEGREGTAHQARIETTSKGSVRSVRHYHRGSLPEPGLCPAEGSLR